MRYLDEFGDPELARNLLADIEATLTGPTAVMEVCGGQTHAIIRNGIDQLLPGGIELIHGPGCPVCVTPLGVIDKALDIAARPEVVFCSFGDMLRVPGSDTDLFGVKGGGGDVRTVYSPLDALRIARDHPDRQVVFFAIGFETTAPANAMSVHLAEQEGIDNYSMLVSHVLVPPAIDAIAGSPANRVDGFLAAGHVCSVMGTREYDPLVARHHVPIVVTGFEPLDVLAYERVVTETGNIAAQEMVAEVFEVCDRQWRGIGEIPASGWRLSPRYRDFDAEHRFGVSDLDVAESALCRSGEVLQGLVRPHECEAFGRECTPRNPLGATMVSAEGACAAYYRYRRIGGVEVGVGDD